MSGSLLRDPLKAFGEVAPVRVASLVPSWTGSLFDLGLGSALAAVTDYCSGPAQAIERLERVGGPKTPAVEAIVALRPDLVIANQEENSREAVEALAEAGLWVWLTYPHSVRAMLDDLYTAASLFRSEAALQRVQALEKTAEWAETAAPEATLERTFCPIWQDRLETGEPWWMTFNGQTYSHDVLRICGGANVFADRNRRYPFLADLGYASEEDPGQRDLRYPRVSLREILATQPEVILLPDEPYAYSEAHCQELMELFSETPAVKAGRVSLIDGSLLHWPGTRLANALAELPALLSGS
jgi:ABC-type Fe3+-hydroxamate transport system substrate-binding protein